MKDKMHPSTDVKSTDPCVTVCELGRLGYSTHYGHRVLVQGAVRGDLQRWRHSSAGAGRGGAPSRAGVAAGGHSRHRGGGGQLAGGCRGDPRNRQLGGGDGRRYPQQSDLLRLTFLPRHAPDKYKYINPHHRKKKERMKEIKKEDNSIDMY